MDRYTILLHPSEGSYDRKPPSPIYDQVERLFKKHQEPISQAFFPTINSELEVEYIEYIREGMLRGLGLTTEILNGPISNPSFSIPRAV